MLKRKSTLRGKTGTLDFLKGPTPRLNNVINEKKVKLIPLTSQGSKINLTERQPVVRKPTKKESPDEVKKLPMPKFKINRLIMPQKSPVFVQ